MEVLQSCSRRARKGHICNYCGEVITAGETYRYTKIIDGGLIYDWKAHLDCEKVASGLWNFIDPDDGMTEDDFQCGCHAFCRVFICPDCKHVNREYDECECNKGKPYCIDKIAKLLDEYTLERSREEYSILWKLKRLEEES